MARRYYRYSKAYRPGRDSVAVTTSVSVVPRAQVRVRRPASFAQSAKRSGRFSRFETRYLDRPGTLAFSGDLARSGLGSWSQGSYGARKRDFLRVKGTQVVRDRYRQLRQLVIEAPYKVGLCLKRKMRREVLFAKMLAGSSGSAPKKHYRRTQDSIWRC